MTETQFEYLVTTSRGLTKKLQAKYPLLFQPCECRFQGQLHNCDVSCWLGWFPLLDRLCYQIQYHVDQGIGGEPSRNVQPVFTCIKEKLATLRIHKIYINNETKKQVDRDQYVEGLINATEYEASNTCEFCGANQNVGRTSKGWFKTVCKDCVQYQDNESSWIQHPANPFVLKPDWT